MDKANGRYIYFIVRSDTHEIKIGMSYDPVDRFLALQSELGISLRLVGILPTKAQSDRYMHRKFKKYRTKGEWFMPVPAVITFIDENATLDIPELQLDRLEPQKEDLKSGAANSPLTIYQIRRKLGRIGNMSGEPCIPGIYHPNDKGLFSLYHYNYFYQIFDTAEYEGKTWVFILPVTMNGRKPTDRVRGRVMNWFPLDSLEWVTFHIEPPKPRGPYQPKRNYPSIEDAKRILSLLGEGVTQVKVAAQLGVSQSYISAIKLGKIKRYRHLL